jgi:signal transduction histidine kinase
MDRHFDDRRSSINDDPINRSADRRSTPNRMKRVVIPLALAMLVAGLAALQYRWLGQVSDAERDRMRASVRARATQIGETFDREITRAYFLLQLDPQSREQRDWSVYAARVQAWRASSAFPGIVDELLLAERGTDGSVTLQRFNVEAGTFAPAEWPARAVPLREWFEKWGPVIQPIRPDVPALVMPTPDLRVNKGNVRIEAIEGRPAVACVFALLDAKYLTGEMLPELLRRHFGAGSALEYDAIVREREQPAKVLYASDASRVSATDPPDAAVGFFDLRLDMLADLRTSGLLGDAGPDGKRRFSFSILQTGPIRVPVGSVHAPGPGGPRWELTMRHRAGSLEAAVASVRRRNLLISSGILGLLAISVGFVLLSARRAERLAAQQVEFVAGVSHELRTPLAVIRSAGENLADGVVSDAAQVRRYGTLVREEGQRLTDLVEQVLAYAGIQSPHAAAARRPCAPSDVVALGIAQARDAIDHSGANVEVDVPSDLPRVLADPSALARAVANLVTNAIKYGGNANWVGVSARVQGREVALTVSDRGAGIAPADLPHIFDPFYRAASVVAAQIHGTGLGLTVVQGIARAQGGRVTVTSAPGEGSAFTIHLPTAAPDVTEYPGVSEHSVPGAPQI